VELGQSTGMMVRIEDQVTFRDGERVGTAGSRGWNRKRSMLGACISVFAPVCSNKYLTTQK